MNTRTKTIDIQPHRSLMPKIGQTGYSVSQAIAELVDNSIDARIEGKVLTVEVKFDQKNETLTVRDDGVGMDQETAANSFRLAHSDKQEQLGEFGLGMKTASTSLGKEFSVVTSPEGSQEESEISYNEKEWLETGDWSKHPMLVRSGVAKDKSGTELRISQLNFKVYPNLPGRVREDLETRFAPFLENKEVLIKVNTMWCEPKPLELNTEYHLPDGREEFRLTLESGTEVRGWRGLLKRGSDKGHYGFRVFRRGRLIEQDAKIGFSPHPEARQITGELHLDHVPVTHNKREFIEESTQYQEVIREDGIFWNFMRDIVREARSSMRKTRISQGIIDKMELRKENIMKAVSKIPELKEYAFPESSKKKSASKDEAEGRDILDIEKRDQGEVITVVEEPVEKSGQKRNPKRTHQKRTYYITICGKKFRLHHSFVDLQTEDVLKDVQVDPVEGIHVFTNIAFPAFADTHDDVFYGAWNIAEAVAEVMVQQNERPYDEVPPLRDLILKETAQITRELDEVDREKKSLEKMKKEYDEKRARIDELQKRQKAVAQ